MSGNQSPIHGSMTAITGQVHFRNGDGDRAAIIDSRHGPREAMSGFTASSYHRKYTGFIEDCLPRTQRENERSFRAKRFNGGLFSDEPGTAL